MDWELVEKDWENLKAMAHEQWAELTSEDLKFIAGRRDRLVRALQRRYGIGLVPARSRVDWWVRNLRMVSHSSFGEYPKSW